MFPPLSVIAVVVRGSASQEVGPEDSCKSSLMNTNGCMLRRKSRWATRGSIACSTKRVQGES